MSCGTAGQMRPVSSAGCYLFRAEGGLWTLVFNQGSVEVDSCLKVTPRVEVAEAGQKSEDEEELLLGDNSSAPASLLAEKMHHAVQKLVFI